MCPGGHVANVRDHGGSATLQLESLWTRDVTITTGLVETCSTPTLGRLLETRQIGSGRFATHHFPLEQVVEVHEVCSSAARTGTLKVLLARKR